MGDQHSQRRQIGSLPLPTVRPGLAPQAFRLGLRSRCLRQKYPQYRTEPPNGAVLAVDVTEVREWSP